MPDSLIQAPIHCSTADEFLKAISPVGPNFKTLDLSEPWLFRGQGYDRRLIPSLFRNYGRTALLAGQAIETYPDLLLAERNLLAELFEMADRRGLILPDDSQVLRTILGTLRSPQFEPNIDGRPGGTQPSKDLLSLAALAQHYRFPTRLLDWTPRSMVAAYFAGESAWHRGEDRKPGDLMVVWSFRFAQMGKEYGVNDNAPIRVITAPTATNPYLRAQQGVFTWLHPDYSKEREIDYTRRTDDREKEDKENQYCPINEVLEEEAAKGLNPDVSGIQSVFAGCTMRKFTAPAEEAENLLFLLTKLDITPSAIYPGYHTLIKDLEMRNLGFRSRVP